MKNLGQLMKQAQAMQTKMAEMQERLESLEIRSRRRREERTPAPPGMENLFILIPVAPGLSDEEEIRSKYFDIVIERIEKLTQQSFKSNIIFKRSYAHRDFIADYHPGIHFLGESACNFKVQPFRSDYF